MRRKPRSTELHLIPSRKRGDIGALRPRRVKAMSETEQRTLIKLPFPGFYYSWYSDALDSEESQWAEYEADERQKEEGVPEHLRITGNEICEILMNVTNYSACHEAVAKLYVDAFDSVILSLIHI